MRYAMGTDVLLPDCDQHFASLKGGPVSLLTYQHDRLLAAVRHMKGPDCFRLAIDVGAHVGLITKQLACWFNRVIAFEPNPVNRECLMANTAQCTNVVVRPEALGANVELRGIRMHDTNSGDSWLHGPDASAAVSVATIPLDSLKLDAGQRRVGLLKIDVQGGEYHVLQGAEQLLRQHHPVILMECEPEMPEQRFGVAESAARDFLVRLGAKRRERISRDYIYSWD